MYRAELAANVTNVAGWAYISVVKNSDKNNKIKFPMFRLNVDKSRMEEKAYSTFLVSLNVGYIVYLDTTLNKEMEKWTANELGHYKYPDHVFQVKVCSLHFIE